MHKRGRGVKGKGGNRRREKEMEKEDRKRVRGGGGRGEGMFFTQTYSNLPQIHILVRQQKCLKLAYTSVVSPCL